MSVIPRFSSEIRDSNSQDVKEEASNNLWAESETVVNSLTTISEETPELVDEILKPKRELKKITWGQDSYEGSVVLNNLHGSGFYFTQQNGEKFFYDGLFYANKLEGYTQVFYENGTHFQGLFQKHRRFGPGILTYPDGTQDVGFWNGFLLSRLACVIGGNSVPSLASSAAGKTKLLCTKYMVPLNQNENDLVNLALDLAGSDEDNVDFSGVFNEEIRNPNSLFFHTQLFDAHFFGSDNCTIKVSHQELADEEEEEKSLVDGQAVERTENLKRKIHEVNETLQTYIVIRQSLQRRVNKCKKCCKQETSEQSTEKFQEKDQLCSLTQESHEAANVFPSANSLKGLENVADIIAEDIEDFQLSASIAQLPNHSDECACAEDENEADLQNLEEQLQNICTQEIFYRNIRDELTKKLDRLAERMSNKPESETFKLVHVNEVWAWNNENSLISMQKHAFKHRNSEEMVNFRVPSLITGNRKEFGAAGAHEEIGQKFLISCYKGKKGFVSECLRNNKIDPNLSDSRGNSGMFFAAANNQQDIIAILTNFGAKVDQLNDEQLTPLSLCFLKYISAKNGCKDWEKAFLPGSQGCDLPELPKWYDIKSFQSSTTSSSKTSTCRDEGSNQQLPCSNLRIIDLLRRISNIEQAKDGLRPSCSSTYVFDLNCNINKVSKQTHLEPDANLILNLELIQLTIMTLLDYGANPNGCEVPYPPLVLSLFTETPDLVKEVIKANADIDVVIDDNVSCLHIAASMNPSLANTNICRIIVKYGCNPNVKTSPNHWIDRKCGITGKLPEDFQVADDGKNVLHLLCMRTDFEADQSNYFCAGAKILLETNLDLSAMYLGHTALSLAVLVGNVKLAQCLIKANIFDPYKQLDYGMGNILTLFALKRFENILPLDKCKAMLTALFEVGLNVLTKVANSENVTAFVEDEDTFFDAFVPKTPKKEPRDKSKKDKHYTGAVKEFLRSLGRQTIIKQVQMEVTYLLFELTEEDMLNSSEIFATLTSLFLTPEVLLLNLKKLFEYGKIEHDRQDNEHVKTLLDFVNTHKKPLKTKAKKTDKKTGTKPQEANDAVETLHLEFERTLNLHFIPPKNMPLPAGLDDPQKYLICYHCLRGKEKTLKICPRCQMVFFCSSQCNKLNLKLKTLHTCNVLFYDMANGEQAAISKGVSLRELADDVREKCVDRLSRMRESKLEEEERKLLQMWRADTYGTRFLQIKPLLDKAVTALSKKKGKQLNWNLGLLQGLLERNFRKHPGDTSLYSLENLLIKLHGKDWFRILGQTKSEGTIRTKQSWSTRRSTLGGSTLYSMIFQLPEPEEKLKQKSCKCSKKITRSKSKDKIKANIQKAVSEPNEAENDPNVNKLDVLFSQEEKRPVIRKLKKIPTRYQNFVEIVATYFPDIDISQWLLPYACCSGGQLFYRFCYNNDVLKESYSFT